MTYTVWDHEKPSPDLNLTTLAAFFTFFAERSAALGKKVKKQHEVSDLNQG